MLSGTVWQSIGMAIDLNNVTIELVLSHDQGPDYPECSLAKLDFISSTFRFDSFSNQSKDVDLVSHEIVASDTRYRGGFTIDSLLSYSIKIDWKREGRTPKITPTANIL